MQELFIDNQPAMQILTVLGIGAILVIVGCFLSKSLLDLLDRFSRLDLACKGVVLFFVVQLTMFGGAKHGGTNDVDGTNGEAESFPLQGNELRGRHS